MSRGEKSPKWHELKRREHLVTYLEMQLNSGRYAADQDKAVSYISKEKRALALLENQLQQEV